MADVEFHDFSVKVTGEIDNAINATLYEVAGELVARTKRNSRKDTRDTSNSFDYKVDESSHTAFVGSNKENALWEELGTGEYALNGDGRKGGWVYKNPKARYNKNGKLRKGSKEFFFTYGKKPSRAFHKAFTSLKPAIIKKFNGAFKELK